MLIEIELACHKPQNIVWLVKYKLCNLYDDVTAFYEWVWLLMFPNGDTFSHGKRVNDKM